MKKQLAYQARTFMELSYSVVQAKRMSGSCQVTSKDVLWLRKHFYQWHLRSGDQEGDGRDNVMLIVD